MKPIHDMGVAELGAALQAKSVSSVEVTKHLLSRVASHDALGAILHVDEAHALHLARRADER
ncbi:MAG: Asp-tRNA(Asn)/Glu-tRNA(Gln) amidotransferase GatCAB subunit A, partial [Pseudomonadota bacterium]|nr:Asp-tRNA(Asn)/Glu-tRNA(Gln) amidotransferase GatCAB subunit A [Pseudomonadota bacterium]